MKKTISTSMIVALALVAGSLMSAPAQAADDKAAKARDFYQQGMRAKQEGRYQLAKTSFQQVLRIYPNHPQARRQLMYLHTNRDALATKNRKKQLHEVVIPKVDMHQVSPQEALDILSALVKQESKQKVSPNFIIQDRSKALDGKTVTLNLSRVPADTLLRYIADQAGAVARYDTHAIVLIPRQKLETSDR